MAYGPTDHYCRKGCTAIFADSRERNSHEDECGLCECGTALEGQFSGGEEHFDRHGNGECATCHTSRLIDEARDHPSFNDFLNEIATESVNGGSG